MAFVLSGVTIGSDGNPLVGATVKVFRTSSDAIIGSTTSGVAGAYSIVVPDAGPFFAVAHKTGSPYLAGVTQNTLTAIEDGAAAAALDLNFADNTYSGGSVTAASQVLTTDYAATRNAKNAAGANTSFAANVLARTDLGIYRAAGTITNLQPNPTLSGAAAGSGTPTAGTLPTGWAGGEWSGGGVNRQIYVDGDGIRIRYYGTALAGSAVAVLVSPSDVPFGMTATLAMTLAVTAGDYTNVSFARVRIEELNSSLGAVADRSGFELTGLTASDTDRSKADFAPTNAATVKSRPYLQFISTPGGAVDITLRIKQGVSFTDNAGVAASPENITATGALDTALKATVGAVMIEFGSLTDHGAKAGTTQSGRILSSRSEALELIKQLGPTRMKAKGVADAGAAYAGAGGILGVNRVMMTWDNAASAGAGQIKLCYNGGTVVTIAGKVNDAGDVNSQVDTAKFLQGLVGFMRHIKTWTTAPSSAEMKTETSLASFNHNVANAVNLFNRAVTFDSDFDNGLSMVTRNTNPAGYGEGTAPVYNNNGKFNPRQINGKEFATGFSNHDAKEYQWALDPTHPDLIAMGYSPFSVANGIVTATGLRLGSTAMSSVSSGALTTLMNDTAKVPNLQFAALDGTRHRYTAGVLTTQGTFKQAFGYWEANASADAYYPGRWSAFWMGGDRAQTLAKNAAIMTAQGDDPNAAGTWPPELDVMECQTDEAFGNAWWGPIWYQAHQIPWNNGKSVADDTGNDWTDYHSYSMDWKLDGFYYYVDGRQYQYFPRPVAGQPRYPGAPGGEEWTALEANRWAYHDGSIEMYILMTHTIGSDQSSLDGTITNMLIDNGGITPDSVQVRWRHAKVWL